MNTDKENEYKNAVLIRFRNKEKALKYFKAYNGQIQGTDLISLCNFDDPHSLKAELEKAKKDLVHWNKVHGEILKAMNDEKKMIVKNYSKELEKARELIRIALTEKFDNDGWIEIEKQAKEFLKKEGE